MNIFKGRPKLALTAIIFVVVIGSYLTFLFPYIVAPAMLVMVMIMLLYVLWLFAKMISEDD